MPSAVHKFFCDHCDETLFAETAGLLASALNQHNEKKHPMFFCKWMPDTIIASAFYSEPSEPPSYLVPYTGNAKGFEITEKDRAFLKRGCIRWE